MSDSLSLVIRSADQTRKAAVSLPVALTVDQLLQATQQRWNLPSNTNYFIRLERTNQQLDFSATLISAGIQEGDVLEVFFLPEGGQK